MLKTGRSVVLSISILSLLFLVTSAMAHAPLGSGDNESIEKATVIPDPTKSWAIYAELHSDGDAQYYTFNITTGQKIHAMLFKSMRSEESGFAPRVVIVGPNIIEQGTIPAYVNVTIPSGLHARVVESVEPAATYEPFSPSSFYSLSDETIDSPVAGTYYVVVYEQSSTPTGGHYGLAIGDRETYTIDEWILIPFNLMTIYQWEGQSLALVFTPMIAVLVVGITLVIWLFRKHTNLANPMAWLGAIAGLTFIGTAATTLYQMLAAATHVAVGAEAIITLIFASYQRQRQSKREKTDILRHSRFGGAVHVGWSHHWTHSCHSSQRHANQPANAREWKRKEGQVLTVFSNKASILYWV
jgi:hypothetical protein